MALTIAEHLEADGKAGFGWGVAWVRAPGSPLQILKHPGAITGDPLAESLRDVQAQAVLIHLRMPSDMSTVGMPDTQPFHDARARSAFAHNGFLPKHDEWRVHYAPSLLGRADSEVGWRHFCLHATTRGVESALRAVTDDVGGPDGFANLAVLDEQASIHMLCMNNRNRVCELRDGEIAGFSTTVHRDDASGLRSIFPTASLSLIPVGGYRAIAPQPAQV